jgi:carboxypeptidase C (cathepsin A)
MCIGTLCYEENSVITKYLSDPALREQLGVDPGVANFSSCSNEVGSLFNARLDKWAVPTQHYVSGLLDRGVRVLIYAGTYDWQCNWVANRMWVDKLVWSGGLVYAALEWADWSAGGETGKAGEVKQAEGLPLAFVTIRGAGHMMSRFPSWTAAGCTDTPFCTCRMISRWRHWRCFRRGYTGGSSDSVVSPTGIAPFEVYCSNLLALLSPFYMS